MIDFKKVNSVYFVGIGGIGISAVARMFLLHGKKVVGSDLSAGEVTEELTKLGAKITIGQGMELIPVGIDLIIYTVAIEKYAGDFLAQIKASGIPSLSYPEALHEISKGKYTIAVAGTHGKTTTTAMIAKVLVDAGLDPTVIVGSFLVGEKSPKAFGGARPSNFIAGKSKYFVVEACEYKRSFLELEPTIGVILNIDDDHLDYYGDMAGVEKGFAEFVGKIKKEGTLVCNPRALHAAAATAAAKTQVVDYMEFFDAKLSLKFPGDHLRKDAAAALAVASILGIDQARAKKSLAEFCGTWRRFEYKGKMKSGALLYDDYGHHPTEIEATITGVREKFADKKLTIVFQPHLYSRTKDHLTDFARVLATADRIILAPIFAAREKPDLSVSSELLAQKVREKNANVQSLKTFDDIAAELHKSTSSADIIITLGAGDIYKVVEQLIEK